MPAALLVLAFLADLGGTAGPEPARLSYPAVDVPVTLGLGAVWMGLWSAQDDLIDPSCPCDRDDLNGFDRLTVGGRVGWAERAADAAVITVLAGAALTLAMDAPDDATLGDEMLVVSQGVVLTGLLTQVTKTLVARPYPYMYQGPEDGQLDGGENYASFWSGHTAVPMAAAVGFATVYGRRHPRGAGRVLAWTLGPALALGAGALQVAAANHHPSDVLVGALVGGGVGFLNPWLRD